MDTLPTIPTGDVNPTFRALLALLKATTTEQQEAMRRLASSDDGKAVCAILTAAYDQLHADMESAAYPQVIRLQSQAQAVRALALFIGTGGTSVTEPVTEPIPVLAN